MDRPIDESPHHLLKLLCPHRHQTKPDIKVSRAYISATSIDSISLSRSFSLWLIWPVQNCLVPTATKPKLWDECCAALTTAAASQSVGGQTKVEAAGETEKLADDVTVKGDRNRETADWWFCNIVSKNFRSNCQLICLQGVLILHNNGDSKLKWTAGLLLLRSCGK